VKSAVLPDMGFVGKYKGRYFLLALAVLLLDQATKHWALQSLDYAVPQPVVEYLNWTLLFNTGAAFSFLANAGGWQHILLGGIAVTISGLIIVSLHRLPAESRLLLTALALVLGGAVGNVYDRFTLGYVVDFIDVYLHSCGALQRFFAGCHWPAFNVADSAISLGALLLLVDTVRNSVTPNSRTASGVRHDH